jgi:hypothetical protein
MKNLTEACWEGYKQVGMKDKGGKMVPNCVPMEESIFKFAQALATAKSAANKPLAGKKPELKLPSASGVVKGGAPEPKVYTINEPKKITPKTADEFRAMLANRKGVSEESKSKEQLKNMSRDDLADYFANKAEKEGHPALSIDQLAKHSTNLRVKQLAGAAMRMMKPGLEENEINEYCPRCLMEVLRGEHPEQLGEAQYQGRSVPLGKPMRGDVKKFKVFVKDPSTGNIKKVNFGDKTMKIKKSNPKRRKSFRARHHCDTNPGPRTKARYWSCRKW